jgi:hypothetical protein
MTVLGVLFAILLIVGNVIDTFEVVVLPRRVNHGFRLSRTYYLSAWAIWRAAARRLPAGRVRSGFLGAFGPLSLFGLMSIWAAGMIIGFALLHMSLATDLEWPDDGGSGFFAHLYFSGTTFFTLGYGDIVPRDPVGRLLGIFEAGLGFGFLAVVISYVPVIYQTFSRREVVISMLDARAGSPPSAGELLRRAGGCKQEALRPLLAEWERWSAELLESHVSFPLLGFYRSQHDNQSWVAALTTILDTSAVLIADAGNVDDYQARLTFAMARHAAVDLCLVSQMPPSPPPKDRLPAADLERLRLSIRGTDERPEEGAAFAAALAEIRILYEPFVFALADRLLLTLPRFVPAEPPVDNWRTSPLPRSPELRALAGAPPTEDHFYGR